MAQQKKIKQLRLFTASKFSFIQFCFLIILSLIIIGLDNRYKYSLKIYEKIFFIKIPIISIINIPSKIMENFKFIYINKTALIEENETLKNQIQKLKLDLQQFKFYEKENTQLKKILKIKDIKNLSTVAAEIKLPSKINGSRKFFLNKGYDDAINLGDPVLNNDGLIGQIKFVKKTISELIPINAPNFVVSAVLENGKENLLIFGNGGPFLEIPLFPIHRIINIGDIFVTSGIDEVYPKGIKIGKVIEIIEERRGQFFKVIVEPFASPETFSNVIVVTNISK